MAEGKVWKTLELIETDGPMRGKTYTLIFYSLPEGGNNTAKIYKPMKDVKPEDVKAVAAARAKESDAILGMSIG